MSARQITIPNEAVLQRVIFGLREEKRHLARFVRYGRQERARGRNSYWSNYLPHHERTLRALSSFMRKNNLV